jgi:hypothetical protein
VETSARLARAGLIEKCANEIERTGKIRFDLLAEVGIANRLFSGYEITIEEIHAYHKTLMDALRKARTFLL